MPPGWRGWPGDSARVRTVLSNAVRFADRLDAPTVDVLDAARRLVPMDVRHLDRSNAEGFMKSGKEMHEVAEEICRYAGLTTAPGVPPSCSRRPARSPTSACSTRGPTWGSGRCTSRSSRSQSALLGGGAPPPRGGRGAPGPRAEAWMGLAPRSEEPSGAGRLRPPDEFRSPVSVTARGSAADLELRAGARQRSGGATALPHASGSGSGSTTSCRRSTQLGFASYFLTVGDVTEMIRDLGIRSAARGSGAGSLVNYLLGISGVDPIRHGLLMERFLSPLRRSLPDIDIDVESARRLEVYDAILERFGKDRCATVSMMDTYKVRHAIRDVGAALGMPMGEIDAIAKAFPHIRARDARMALRDLPELRSTGMAREAAAGEWGSFDMFFRLVESLDGLPRHIAMHPCGVLLSDRTLLDRTPVEQSFLGYPMSQFDKEDVEDLGLLKLDVLGIRMQSAMAHAVEEIERTEGRHIDLDDEVQVPFDDPHHLPDDLRAKTLGVFQIESPGQRELVGKSGIEDFSDIITDISLFRPGPVKSDMITPYLEVKQGWKSASYLHEDLRPILEGTRGVVVFHEQVIEMIAQFAGCTYAEGDEWRRALGDKDGMAETKTWFYPRALGRGYPLPVVEQIWKVIEAFASFGFCKAHAAAFALPTYQSAWLKAHYPAHFISGVLTHDPGMYPKRLILDDARQLGIAVLGLDVNASEAEYVVEKLADTTPVLAPGEVTAKVGRFQPRGGIYTKLPEPVKKEQYAWMGHGWGIRLALGEVRGINDGEVSRIVGAREGAPYASLTDFWQRAQVARPVVERLVQAGAFDTVYGIGTSGTGRRNRLTRRDLLLEIGDLDRLRRASDRASKGRARGLPRSRPGVGGGRGRLGAARPRPRGARGPAGERPAGDERRRPGARRAGHPRPRRQQARDRLPRPLPRPARDHPVGRPALGAQPQRAAGGRGEGGHPDPADPVGPPGHLPDPRRRHRTGRRDLLRGRAGALRRHGLRLLAARRPRGAAPDRPPRCLAAGDRRLGPRGAARPVAGGGDGRRARRDRPDARGLRATRPMDPAG